MKKNDKNTTIKELREITEEFRRKRNWDKAKLKHLVEAFVVEASELQEVFLWKDDKKCEGKLEKKLREDAASELVDVIWYGLAIANKLGIDLMTEITRVMKKNEKRFPVEEFANLTDAEERLKAVRRLKNANK